MTIEDLANSLLNNMALDADLRWIDMVPCYTGSNIRLGWRVTQKREQSLSQNPLNDRHSEFGFPAASPNEISRNIYGKARWGF